MTELTSNIPYVADISEGLFRVSFANEELQVSPNNTVYIKNGMKFNPT